MQKKTGKEKNEEFAFRIKMGDYEIELKGEHKKVIDTLQAIPNLIKNLQKSLEDLKPKTVATLTVKRDKPEAIEKPAQKYPKILSATNCREAILEILRTDWGKWRPRTEKELRESIMANKLKYSSSTSSKALSTLVKKGLVRRWNTNAGFVYILAEEKRSSSRGKK